MGTEDYVFIGGDDPAFNDAGGKTEKKGIKKKGKYHCPRCGAIHFNSKTECCGVMVVLIGL